MEWPSSLPYHGFSHTCPRWRRLNFWQYMGAHCRALGTKKYVTLTNEPLLASQVICRMARWNNKERLEKEKTSMTNYKPSMKMYLISLLSIQVLWFLGNLCFFLRDEANEKRPNSWYSTHFCPGQLSQERQSSIYQRTLSLFANRMFFSSLLSQIIVIFADALIVLTIPLHFRQVFFWFVEMSVHASRSWNTQC